MTKNNKIIGFTFIIWNNFKQSCAQQYIAEKRLIDYTIKKDGY